MLVPYNASGEAAAPIARLARAALDQGLYLMTHWNVIMVVPPLTITREEADEGIAILDEVAHDRRRVRRVGSPSCVSSVAELTARLVEIESINPDVVAGGSGESGVARFVADWCERAGLETRLEEPVAGPPERDRRRSRARAAVAR